MEGFVTLKIDEYNHLQEKARELKHLKEGNCIKHVPWFGLGMYLEKTTYYMQRGEAILEAKVFFNEELKRQMIEAKDRQHQSFEKQLQSMSIWTFFMIGLGVKKLQNND